MPPWFTGAAFLLLCHVISSKLLANKDYYAGGVACLWKISKRKGPWPERAKYF